MESILLSIKKLLGITEEYKHFDPDIIMHINTVFDDLSQLGVVPYDDFRIEDETSVWTDYVPDAGMIESIKSYMYLRVKLLFDPPLNSSIIESMNRQIERLEWRINTSAESHPVKKEDLYKLEEVTCDLELRPYWDMERLITPSPGYDGISKVIVNLSYPTNTYVVRPSTSTQYYADIFQTEGYFPDPLIITPVTSDIDENIKPENILEGIEILGVKGANKGYQAGVDDGWIEGMSAGYNKGREEGFNAGKQEGVVFGVQQAHRAFMDNYQEHGNRGDCTFMFAGTGWTTPLFVQCHPTYDLKPTNASNMFLKSRIDIDLAKFLETVNIKLDTSLATWVSCMFQDSRFTRIPALDLRSCTQIDNLFRSCPAHTIDELIVTPNVEFLSGCFQYMGNLTSLRITGTLGHSIYLQNIYLLDVESAMNILQNLEGYDSTDNKFMKNTVKLHKDVWTRLRNSGYLPPLGADWESYVSLKGWAY